MRTKLFVLAAHRVFGRRALLPAQEAEHVWTVSELFTRNSEPSRNSARSPAASHYRNLYYVGTQSLSSFVVDTPAGDILIDSTYEVTFPSSRIQCRSRLKFSNIKIIPGQPRARRSSGSRRDGAEMTGAKVMGSR